MRKIQTKQQKYSSKKTTLLFSLLIFLVGLIFVTLTIGSAKLGLSEVMRVIAAKLPVIGEYYRGEIDPIDQKIILEIRLPRIILAVMVGSALSVTGVIFQGLFRNPMADPYVLGTSSGAALGATLAVVLNSNLTLLGLSSRPIFAFVGAMLATVLVYNIARVGTKPSITVLILAGIAVSAFLSAITSLLLFFRQEEMGRIIFWMMGGFSYCRWSEVKMILPYLLIGLLYTGRFSRELNLLLLGEEKAHQLGLEVGRLQKRLIFAAAFLVAAAVSVSGVIGFVGLVVPHIIRLLIGPDHRSLLPVSAVAGGIFLLIADTLARIIISPAELPVGVLTSFVGGLFFIYLLRKSKRAG